jgi:YidC/Oxa1 family membrane protein insertase
MEKRAVLAAILMAGLLLVYQMLFSPVPEPERPAPDKTAAPAPATPGTAPGSAPAAPPGVPSAAVPTPAPAPSPATPVPERSAVIETPFYRAVVTSAGGALREWQLNYRGSKPMVIPGVMGPRGVVVERPDAPAQPVAFTLSTDSIKLGPGNPHGELKLTGEDGFGLRITQTLRFHHDNYVVEHDIRVENRHTVPQRADIVLSWTAPVEWPKEHENARGPRPVHVVRYHGDGYWVHREYPTNAQNFVGDGRWVGIEAGVPTAGGVPMGQNGVYLIALIPKSPGVKVTEARIADPTDAKKPPKAFEIGLRAPLPALAPGQMWEGKAQTYLGPMEYDRLKSFGVGLEKAIYFGGFPLPESKALEWGLPTIPMEWIAVPILWFMHWIYGFTRNYGVAIIILTVLSKLLFFPLSLKSMRSMKAMQALQPQVNALRAKYKNEPQRVQRETMELYRQQRVNPLGGCLPMVVQIPIFYALYVALAVSVELQNQPFLCIGHFFGMDLWICDLAAQDPTYVLPILMGVTMFVQQKMTPVMGDPRQAKMMLIMPVVFTFMFLNLPSGLVLYWTLSNVLQIAQQHYMNLESKSKDEKAPARAPKKA